MRVAVQGEHQRTGDFLNDFFDESSISAGVGVAGPGGVLTDVVWKFCRRTMLVAPNNSFIPVQKSSFRRGSLSWSPEKSLPQTCVAKKILLHHSLHGLQRPAGGREIGVDQRRSKTRFF